MESTVLALHEWLAIREPSDVDARSTPHSWWILPSRARPRFYFPTQPHLWPAALELVSSPLRRRIAGGLLRGMRVIHRQPHLSACADSPLESWLRELFPERNEFSFASYIGTTSIFVKDTIQCLDHRGNAIAYLKIPRGNDAFATVRHEANILAELAQRFPDDSFYPTLLGRRNGAFLQSTFPNKPNSAPNDGPGWILARLAEGWRTKTTWQQSPARSEILNAIAALREAGAAAWVEVLERADATLTQRLGSAEIHHPLSHGDFVPWNLRPGPFAFDWEWAAPRLPWHDAFHHLWMPQIASGKASGFAQLWNDWTGPHGSALRRNQTISDLDETFALGYLAWQTSFYAFADLRNGDPLESTSLPAKLRSLLESFLSTTASVRSPLSRTDPIQ